MNKEDYIEIGFVGKPHGYKGHMNLSITSEDDVLFEKITFVLLEVNNLLTPFFVENLDYKHKILLKLENVHNDAEAKKLQSKKIFVPKEHVIIVEGNDDSEYVGYELIDKTKGSLGKVIRIEEMPASDVFIVIYKEKEIILPITDDFIEEINETTKIIKYNAPEGLIDLYLE
ncbi:MAG: ribosome maturation factor RimM [Bacteroidia bacterium]|jgi:16S rRNA processing protein RimM